MKAYELHQIVETIQGSHSLSVKQENRLKDLMAGRPFNDFEASILKKLLMLLESGTVIIESCASMPVAA